MWIKVYQSIHLNMCIRLRNTKVKYSYTTCSYYMSRIFKTKLYVTAKTCEIRQHISFLWIDIVPYSFCKLYVVYKMVNQCLLIWFQLTYFTISTHSKKSSHKKILQCAQIIKMNKKHINFLKKFTSQRDNTKQTQIII